MKILLSLKIHTNFIIAEATLFIYLFIKHHAQNLYKGGLNALGIFYQSTL